MATGRARDQPSGFHLRTARSGCRGAPLVLPGCGPLRCSDATRPATRAQRSVRPDELSPPRPTRQRPRSEVLGARAQLRLRAAPTSLERCPVPHIPGHRAPATRRAAEGATARVSFRARHCLWSRPRRSDAAGAKRLAPSALAASSRRLAPPVGIRRVEGNEALFDSAFSAFLYVALMH